MADTLSIKPVLKLIAELPTEYQERLVLIGGQAIAFWGAYFLENRITQAQAAALTSSDLDIVAGTQQGVRLLAQAWNARPHFPTADDQVPNMAVIELHRPELLHRPEIKKSGHFKVDVMNSVYGGLDAAHMVAASELVEWDLDNDGQQLVRFNVMTPPMLLWTRIANLQYQHKGPLATEREIVRTTVLCQIVHEYLWNFAQEMFTDSSARRPALNHAAFVYRDIAKKRETRQVLANHPELIEPLLSAIPRSAHWPEGFDLGVSNWQRWLVKRTDVLIRHRENRAAIRKQKMSLL